MTDILMPKLSDSMEQGTIISWFKEDGDAVSAGDELLEIETDKSTAPYMAESDGVLEVVVPVGTTVAVGEVIARVREGARASASASASADAGASAAEPVESNGNGHAPVDAEVQATEPAGAPVATPAAAGGSSVPDSPTPALVGPGGRNGSGRQGRATPLARRVAAAHGVALEQVSGSGPLGRITRDDVLRAAGIAEPVQAPVEAGPSPSQPAHGTAAPTSAPGVGSRRQELTRLQQLIARRMAEAKSTIPHFQVQTEAAMDAALALRGQFKALAGDEQPVPSVNDLIIKAAAIALRNHPLANGSYRDGAFELHDQVNVGMAVATDGALVVPTVFDADTKSLGELARETRRLAARVREGTIAPPELSGGTFTVSNLGMFGMTAITPVINPPQAAILGVGAVRETLARVDGEIVERSLVTLTLSCDHRILYGADAARFLAEIRELLEAPLRLAL